MPVKYEFTRHVFATLTYSRDGSIQSTWSATTTDYNRFIQRIRRLHNLRVEYLRVLEEHKDGYPHIHAILQYPSSCLRVNIVKDKAYFDRTLYARWKDSWKGNSDYQKPKRSGVGTLSYVLKYLIKNQTKKTIWKKIMDGSTSKIPAPSQTVLNEQLSLALPIRTTQCNGSVTNTITEKESTDVLPTRINGVKLATWSRGFDFKPFLPGKKHIALS